VSGCVDATGIVSVVPIKALPRTAYFFHGVANKKRESVTFFALETDEGEVSDPKLLRSHIEGYYKGLFGKEERAD
jgi:hypothetical protein